ncbi:hypothetical protein [uncultured Methanobrevibacter sp.]|uniref:hypothetical protein n=1 Tax=uncultured Methanobrevibacter sp. TaxID=253161 RepID=UPI0026211C60
MSNNTVRDFIVPIKWGNNLLSNGELIFSVFEGAEYRTPATVKANIGGLAALNRHHYHFLRNYGDDLLIMQIMRFNYSSKVPKNLRFNLVAILNNSHCEVLTDCVQTFPYSPEEWEEERVHMSRDYVLDLLDTNLVDISVIYTGPENGIIRLKSRLTHLAAEAPVSFTNQEIDPILIDFIKKYGGKHVKNYLAQV